MDADASITVEGVRAANEVLVVPAAQARALPGESARGAWMHAYLPIAQLYLLEYAKRRVEGFEPFEALLAAATGELELSQRATEIWQAPAPPKQ